MVQALQKNYFDFPLTEDFCSGGASPGSPAGTILEILRNHEYSQNDITYSTLEYYTKGCVSGYPFMFLNTYFDELENAKESIQTLDTNFSQLKLTIGTELLANLCTGQDFTQIESMLVSARANLDILTGATKLAMKLTECKRINQIYTILAHEALCKDSVSALAWTFSSLLIISVCGFIMITLRTVLVSGNKSVDSDELSTKERQPLQNQDDDMANGSDEEDLCYEHYSNEGNHHDEDLNP